MPKTNFVFWVDKGGKEPVKDLIESHEPLQAIKIYRILADYSGYTVAQMIREGNLEPPDQFPDVYVLKIERKGISIRLFCGISGSTIHLMHGTKKIRFKQMSSGHYETAAQRIKLV